MWATGSPHTSEMSPTAKVGQLGYLSTNFCHSLRTASRSLSLQYFWLPLHSDTPQPEKCHMGSGRCLQKAAFGL